MRPEKTPDNTLITSLEYTLLPMEFIDIVIVRVDLFAY